MTSTTGTDGHPEVAEISALTEGILSPSRTADVKEHLAGCPLCEDVRSSLNEIRGLLGTLPGPMRMPEDIAGRIDAALAAEALLDATAPVDAEAPDPAQVPVSRETEIVAPTVVSRETERVSRETNDRPAGRPRAATGPSRQGPASGARIRRARRWPKVLLGTACAAAVIGVGSFFLQTGDNATRADHPEPAKSPSAVGLASGDLRTRVHELLVSNKSAESRGMSAQSSPETFQDTGTTPPACVRDGIQRAEPALATHQETYNGEDAYLFVLPHSGNTALVDAYVVSATCGTSPSQGPGAGKVLLNETLARN